MSRRAALAVALLALGGARAAPSEDGLPVIDVRAGVPIADLPGRDILLPPGPRAAFGVTLTPARVRVFIAPGDEEPAVSFATPVYRNDIDGHVYLFGPGARLRAPAALDVRVANDLTYAPGAAAAAAPAAHAMAPGQPDYSAYRDPLATNLHTHGLHASPGAGPQAGMAAAYRGGDNVFYEVRAGGSAPALEYTGEVGENHMPGLHWCGRRGAAAGPRGALLSHRAPLSHLLSYNHRARYHPHAHGSSTLQAGTANGLILVDDDDRWLPDDRGCGPLKAALAAAPAEVLLIDILAFATAAVQTKAYQDPNLQVIAARAAPAYPLCCGNSTSTGEGAAEGPLPLDPPGYNTTLALVNGGWQPVLGLVAGEWARWRALHAGWKMTLDLTLVDGAGAPAGCEMALVAKDGVFLLEAPRPVGGLLLNPGNRADVLVRCPAPGNFSLAAGAATSPFGTWSNWYGEFRQPVVAAVVVAPRAAGAPAAPALEAEACAPLRPSYAPDLRDAALKAAGVEPASRPMAFEAIEHNGLVRSETAPAARSN
jgi:FtsP/CotA-like multicopper oxidase with cupredoxin domain